MTNVHCILLRKGICFLAIIYIIPYISKIGIKIWQYVLNIPPKEVDEGTDEEMSG